MRGQMPGKMKMLQRSLNFPEPPWRKRMIMQLNYVKRLRNCWIKMLNPVCFLREPHMHYCQKSPYMVLLICPIMMEYLLICIIKRWLKLWRIWIIWVNILWFLVRKSIKRCLMITPMRKLVRRISLFFSRMNCMVVQTVSILISIVYWWSLILVCWTIISTNLSNLWIKAIKSQMVRRKFNLIRWWLKRHIM